MIYNIYPRTCVPVPFIMASGLKYVMFVDVVLIWFLNQ
jgi:hypothetical protein